MRRRAVLQSHSMIINAGGRLEIRSVIFGRFSRLLFLNEQETEKICRKKVLL